MIRRFITVVLYAVTLLQPLQAQQKESPLWNAPGAGNPFIPGYFADPTIRKFGDTYYLYATTDGTGNGYGPAQVWGIGHFDLPTKFNEREVLYDVSSAAYRDAAFAAMEKLNAAGKVFEINSGAISRGWRTVPYPSEELLRHLHSLGGRILISSDAHSADAMTCAFDRCEALAKSCGFTELWQFTGSGFEAVGI